MSASEVVIEILKQNTQFDYTVNDLVYMTGITYRIVKPVIMDMEKLGQIERVRLMKRQPGNYSVYTYQLPGWLTHNRREERNRIYGDMNG